MARLFLALLAIGSAAAIVRSEHGTEPKFPRLLDGSVDGHTRIHISSERLDQNGVFNTADEYIDLELGKAAYIETTNNVRTTWLVDLKEDTIYNYWPFQCKSHEHASVNQESHAFPYIIKYLNNNGIPKIDVPGLGKMNLFGITGLLESLDMSTVQMKYIKTSSSSAGRANSSEGVIHQWVETGSEKVQAVFTETANSELQLNSLKVKTESGTTTINILSIERSFASQVYNNELQLPLIYGCERAGSKLDAEMKKIYDLVAADANTRYHLKTQSRAIDFAGQNPSSSEQKTIEFALTSERDAKYEQSPANAHMTYLGESCGADCPAIKTVVDHYYNIKYEAKTREGTCTISNAGQMKSYHNRVPVEFVYSNGLKLSIDPKQLSDILYGVQTDNFLKLEKKGDVEYAYFSVTWPEVFKVKNNARTSRVVRRYAISNGGSSYKLDSIAIWIFESAYYNPKVAEVYDFKVVDGRPLSDDANSAQAFDVATECFLNNQEMQFGRDYAWFELDFAISAERAELLKDKVDELKDAFYKSIRANLNVNYMRIPQMEIFFTQSGFTVKLLLLDTPPAHLMYEEFKNYTLRRGSIQKEEQVANLYDCSEFCRKQSCAVMTFDKENNKCSIRLAGVDRDALDKSGSKDTYRIIATNKEFLPKDAQRLEHLLESLKTESGSVDGIMGFSELNHLDTTKGLGNLRTSLRLNGQMVEFVPATTRVQSNEATTETPTVGL